MKYPQHLCARASQVSALEPTVPDKYNDSQEVSSIKGENKGETSDSDSEDRNLKEKVAQMKRNILNLTLLNCRGSPTLQVCGPWDSPDQYRLGTE